MFFKDFLLNKVNLAMIRRIHWIDLIQMLINANYFDENLQDICLNAISR